jgi:protoporphyrinogen oxidase
MELENDQKCSIERPLSLIEAAEHMGISVRYLFNIRKKYLPDFEVCEWRGRKPVFYRNHIEKLREILKWENKDNSKLRGRVGIRSGTAGHIVTISMSKGAGSGGRRASAIQARLR